MRQLKLVSCGSCRFADGTVDASKNTGNIARQTLSFDGLPQPFVTGYEYDSLYRLVNAKETQNGTRTWEQGFTYDRYGNRLSHDKFIGASQISQTNLTHPTIDANTNRFTAGQGYAFDKNGNLVTDPADSGRSFVFNGDNKQKEVRGPSNELIGEYFYDGEGRRVKKHRYVGGVLTEVTVFVYSAGKLAAEYSTAPPEQNPTTKWTVTDQLGSPRVLVDSLGQVVSRRDFMPFGEEIFPDGVHRTTSLKYTYADNVRQKFTGYERDNESGLDFAQARYFAYNHGRFTSPDDFFNDSHVSNPQSWNLYAYVRNNPLSFIDPTGMMTDFIDVGTGERKRIEDGKDQVIAAQSEDIKQFQKEFASDRDAYNHRLGVFESSANNLHMTNAQFDNLAGVIYAEASNNAPWTEAAGIHGVLRNRAAADGTSVSDQATVANGIYGAGEAEKKKISDPNASTAKRNAVYKGLALSIVAFAVNGSDLSGGAYFWHGTDFRRPTAGSTAHESFYRSGFQFTSPSHDIWNLGSRRSGNSRYDYKYQSTAAFGQTTFMKLTEAWMKANGANTWRGTRR
ncbi:MAG: RHS repeat-associated core domain-containing protein [Chloracidobacterium sp.]|nr:RHS repeat-associated core domain-containing protein [Chloracidobacterium sp.]